MERLERSKITAAGEIANERLIEAVAADQEGFDAALAEAVAERRPLAIVYPDGHEIVVS